ncbi:hypothetical protein AB0346_00295 [Nocardia beijingensis]|uniref:hypothetical protein n=1 Tax=Nocardia beijingensis TaxID=95162 RepID=UPI00344E3B6B
MDLALAWLDAAPSLPHLTAQHDVVTMSTPPEVAVSMYGGQLSEPITEAEAKQLVLTSVNVVVVAMRSMWQQVHTLLARAAELAREPEDRRSCTVAALMAHELAHPEQIDYRHDINRRIMALTQTRRTRA